MPARQQHKKLQKYKARIPDGDLWKAAELVASGSVDADLGGGVIKQRIARQGAGKSGGSRVILLFRFKGRMVFAYGFEKKDRTNITIEELEGFRELAEITLGYSESELQRRVADGALIEIVREDKQDGR